MPSVNTVPAQPFVEDHSLSDLAPVSVREVREPHETPRERSTTPTLSHEVTRNLYGAVVALNGKIMCAEAARIGVHAVGISLALPLLISSGAWYEVCCVWGSAVVGIIMNIEEWRRTEKGILKLNLAAFWSESPRVNALVGDLARMSKTPIPETYVVPAPVASAFICDRMFKPDVVVCSMSLVRTLNDQELKGVLAHEISHGGRSVSKFRELSDMLLFASIPSCVLFTNASLINIGLPMGCAVAGALLGGKVVIETLNLITKYISRQTELKTDLRAVAVVGEPQGLISALEKLTAGLPTQGIFDSHPPTEARVSLIRRVFGEQSKV
jgi:heat shock protein HtpX